MTQTSWLSDGNGNEFALIREDDGIHLVHRGEGKQIFTPKEPETTILFLSVEEGIYLAGYNGLLAYPMTKDGAIQVVSDYDALKQRVF